jgi:hypothetical protein
MHRSAEGIPDEIEAPAPKSRLTAFPRFTARERMSASSSSWDGWDVILKQHYQCIDDTSTSLCGLNVSGTEKVRTGGDSS